MSVSRTGNWVMAKKILASAPADVQTAIKQAVYQEGHHFERLVKKAIGRGPPPPLAGGKRKGSGPGKGGSKPLNASGEMKGSVTVLPTTPALEVFIGIPRASARGVRLAEIHEFGKTIVMDMTPKMRKFFFGVLFKGEQRKGGGGTGKGFIVIHIPARPFIRPAFAEGAVGSQERFEARLIKLLSGKLAAP